MLLAIMNRRRLKVNMKEQQILALDFDNARIKSPKQKAEGSHYQSMNDILANEFIQKYAAFAYKTFSYTEDWEKFRVVFILDRILYTNDAVDQAYKYLMKEFPNVDTNTKDSARLFYGGQGLVEINYNNVLPVDILQLNEEKVKGSKLVSSRKQLQSTKKTVTRHKVPTYKLIRQRKFEEVAARWKKYGNKTVPDKISAIIYFKTLPMDELLGISDNPFRDLFESDHEPSCSIWKPDNSDTWLYTNFNSPGKNGKQKSSHIIQVIQKLLRPKGGINAPYDLAIQFLIEQTGIEIEVSAEIEELRMQADQFKEFLLSDTLEYTNPEIHQLFCRYKYVPYINAVIDIVKMNLYDDNGTIRCLTPLSVENFAIRLNCSKQKVSKIMNLMVITEILVKLDEGQIPESLLKTIKQTQQQYIDSNGDWHDRGNPRQYRSNVHELYNIMDNFLVIEAKCIELIEKRFTQKGFSKEWVERVFGEAEANRVFPQDKDRVISKVSNEFTSALHRLTFEQIQDQGYVIVNDLKAEMQKMWKSKGFVEYKYQQSFEEMLETYGLKKIRLTKELKERFGITTLLPQASPTILIKDI